ncbi:MAG: type I DNA topoisomerase, partial [Alphaproteobacteria bacterium]|nr:type I DNA topoisomerase [Alphaproteobacteria bacterium]
AKSAGRVQSVALRLIVERELEIQSFKAEEYWSLSNTFTSNNGEFVSNLTHIDGKKLEKLDIKNEKEAEDIRKDLSIQEYIIEDISKKSVSKNSYAPFTTSTLQQDASHKLGFSTKYTMQLAQKLYEGVTINGAITGLITYMRTDSTNLSDEAIESARKYVKDALGDDYLPSSPKIYKTKAKNAQEAHEAIRPTSCARTPDSIKDSLQVDEFKLYELIWKRTIASQMANAKLNQVSINIKSVNDKYQLKSTGSTLVFDGFLKIYDDSSNDKLNVEKLPLLKKSDIIELTESNKAQHFTQPPARFTEAGLVKKLEELGIGRPSTYATIINVIQERRYAKLQKKTFIPENIGIFTVSFLKNFFARYVEYKFTASMEEELDDISNGKIDWETVLNNFWEKFNKNILSMTDISVANVIDKLEEDIHDYIFKSIGDNKKCPNCPDGIIGLKLSKYGAFLGCSNYPDCKVIIQIGDNNSINSLPTSNENKVVAYDTKNKDNILLKSGRYGTYLEWENTIDEEKKKPKRLSIPKFITDPDELTKDDILTLLNLPRILGKNPDDDNNVILYLGRFGPYLSCGNKTFRLDKSIEFLRINIDKALSIIKSQL